MLRRQCWNKIKIKKVGVLLIYGKRGLFLMRFFGMRYFLTTIKANINCYFRGWGWKVAWLCIESQIYFNKNRVLTTIIMLDIIYHLYYKITSASHSIFSISFFHIYKWKVNCSFVQSVLIWKAIKRTTTLNTEQLQPTIELVQL